MSSARRQRLSAAESGLTPRQRQIMKLIVDGHTNQETADILKLSRRTVEVHRFNLMRRLQVRNVAQLMRVALEHRLLRPGTGRVAAHTAG
jgi:DNA-binding CsgD family transcriptional regulator